MTSVDLVVVGAGIVGLAHAWHAVQRGLSVTVVERDEHAAGASVRNFGHGCFTAQDGVAFEYAMTAREEWLKLAAAAGFWLRESGTVVVARHDDERAVLEEFATVREIQLTDDLPVDGVGGALLPLDIRVNPREAVHAIAALLAERGVTFHWSTNVLTVEPGLVRTTRGEIRCRATVVAVGHDLDRFFPCLAEERQVRRCQLRMLRVAHGGVIDPAVLTGFSMLRYDAFARCPSTRKVRERLTNDHPELVEAGLNLMFTQLPDGSLTIGDTHHYSRTVDPYLPEHLDDLVLTETARLLGVPRLHVLERWRGIYASAPEPFLTATPAPLIRAVSVTSGIGMTTALGLAPAVLDDLLQEM
ncbi:TIGR03364 family FAD-dependent oxidoreductase [Lentzea sp. PSKA42]|uniref:TIGR03364 family FAD-dependent oxidoreductase n=1 Tax=Lentzea indica TaxID=2604800 RepID=A0ABX1FGB0_9PSEU|nr:TIGR03364 family FAD-dependent oxidoreductase [Lentzea indica]NKE57676.1 TIGR03364 family FAD-dependent oxidoreductase [Lentzea indica]